MTRKLLHHGGDRCLEFEATPTPKNNSDYFGFKHKPCKESEHRGYCKIIAILVDNVGRVVFNIQCLDCETIEALKTSGKMFGWEWNDFDLSIFYLSPHLKERIGKHWWDQG